jgi:cell division protein FtsB
MAQANAMAQANVMAAQQDAYLKQLVAEVMQIDPNIKEDFDVDRMADAIKAQNRGWFRWPKVT